MEQRFYRSDPDCIAAGRPLVEFELYQSTVLPLEDKDVRCDRILVLYSVHVIRSCQRVSYVKAVE